MDRPILMSGPMVRAMLKDVDPKTQTRRIMKIQPASAQHVLSRCVSSTNKKNEGRIRWVVPDGSAGSEYFLCPYGQPGDRLWVRESYYQRGHWEPVPGVKTKSGRMKWRFVAADGEIRFDAPSEYRKGRHHLDPATVAWHRRLARFMPRSASRITLEVTGVRVERLQDISEEDAKTEGVLPIFETYPSMGRDQRMTSGELMADTPYRAALALLWDEINGDRVLWKSNPWVWVIEFKGIEAK